MQTLISQTGRNRVDIAGKPPREFADGGYFFGLCDLLGLPHTAAYPIEIVSTAFADHGINPPSTVAVRLAACCGASLPVSLCAGLSAFSGQFHGGGVVDAAKFLSSLLNDPSYPIPDSVPGFGHPLHDNDPRVIALFEQLSGGDHVRLLFKLAKTLKPRPNIAGISAAILLDAGLPADLCQLPLILGRTLGWAAHWKEQSEQPTKNITYNGHAFID